MTCYACRYKDSTICRQCPENKNSFTVSSAHVESTTRHESLAEEKSSGLYKKCRIHVHHRTNRLSDPDGRSVKACIDGLTVAGILPDDSAKFVTEITQSQEKVKGQEETIIIIERAFL